MWPKVPDNLDALGIDELDALAGEIRKVCLAKLATTLSAEDSAEVAQWFAKREEIKALSESKMAAEAAEKQRLADDETRRKALEDDEDAGKGKAKTEPAETPKVEGDEPKDDA